MRLRQQQPLLLLLLLLSLQGPVVRKAAAEQLTSRAAINVPLGTREAAAAAAALPCRRSYSGFSLFPAAAASPQMTVAAVFPRRKASAAAAAGKVAPPELSGLRAPVAAGIGFRSRWSLRREEEEDAAEAAADEQESQHHVLMRRAKNAVRLLHDQVCAQLRQHEPELRVVGRSLGRLALQCIGSLLRLHLLSASVLLPLCTSWGFAEPLARVRLDDPFLLQQLQLPAGATPALYGLNFSEVTIPTEEKSASLPSSAQLQQRQQQQQRQQEHHHELGGSSEEPLLQLPQDAVSLPADQQQQQQQQQQLRAWLIPAEQRNSSTAIICLHGWLSNRQACLPFLQAAKQLKLHRDHHILLLDLRGSGDSPALRRAAAATAPAGEPPASAVAAAASGSSTSGEGWAFEGAVSQLAIDAREDLKAAIRFLKQETKATDIGVYAQGGAAMGVLLLGSEPEWLHSNDVTLGQVLLDSPICSARSLLQQQPSLRKFARSTLMLLQHLAWGLGSRRSAELRRLRACLSLGSLKSSRTTIVVSKEDNLQAWPLLLQQLLLLEEDQRPHATYLVDKGSHCNLAAANAPAFEAAVASAFVSPGLLRRLWRRVWGPGSPPPNTQILTPRGCSAMKEQQQQIRLHEQQVLQQERHEEEEELMEARDTEDEMDI